MYYWKYLDDNVHVVLAGRDVLDLGESHDGDVPQDGLAGGGLLWAGGHLAVGWG